MKSNRSVIFKNSKIVAIIPDSLQGVAALIVVLYHMKKMFSRKLYGKFCYKMLPPVMKAFLFLLFSGIFLQSVYAGNPLTAGDTIPKRIYTTQRIENPPVIDGELDDACWEAGEWQSNYKQYSGLQ